jgi:hypothetical protein
MSLNWRGSKWMSFGVQMMIPLLYDASTLSGISLDARYSWPILLSEVWVQFVSQPSGVCLLWTQGGQYEFSSMSQ